MPKTRVLVVDDAVVMRKLITETLRRDDDFEVVGAAANGRIALQKIPQLAPDVVTLDIEMPEMDGLETLRELRRLYPKLPVIMLSTLTHRGGVATLEALSLGANDYVTKPSNMGSVLETIQCLETDLVSKIKAHTRKHTLQGTRPEPARPDAAPKRADASAPTRPLPTQIVCVGTSTGGPNALTEVFTNLPADFPVPIVVVQHMPPMFTALLAERLTLHSPLHCQEGAEGEPLQPGHAYLAPGGRHMEVERCGLKLRIRLHDGPPENSCRPAVDVLFRSAAAASGGAVLGVVMTGMGQDGLRGCEMIRESHGRVFAQDEATSVVWGMPGAVAQAGYAERVLPLNQIAPEINRFVRESRT